MCLQRAHRICFVGVVELRFVATSSLLELCIRGVDGDHSGLLFSRLLVLLCYLVPSGHTQLIGQGESETSQNLIFVKKTHI